MPDAGWATVGACDDLPGDDGPGLPTGDPLELPGPNEGDGPLVVDALGGVRWPVGVAVPVAPPLLLSPAAVASLPLPAESLEVTAPMAGTALFPIRPTAITPPAAVADIAWS